MTSSPRAIPSQQYPYWHAGIRGPRRPPPPSICQPPGWLVPTTPQRQIQRSPSGPPFIGTHLDSFVLLASLGSGAEPLSSSGDLSLFHVSTAALSTCHPFVLISTSRTPTMGEAYETPGRHPITMSPPPLATPASASIPSPPPCIVPSTASTPRVHVACFSMCA